MVRPTLALKLQKYHEPINRVRPLRQLSTLWQCWYGKTNIVGYVLFRTYAGDVDDVAIRAVHRAWIGFLRPPPAVDILRPRHLKRPRCRSVLHTLRARALHQTRLEIVIIKFAFPINLIKCISYVRKSREFKTQIYKQTQYRCRLNHNMTIYLGMQ